MAEDNNAILSPVGAVWRYIRQNYPLIELYQSDESHPSVAGTYAAACAFYTVLFRKDPNLISYNPSLSAADAASIRAAAKTVVFDSLVHWNIGAYDPVAAFGFSNNGNEINFIDSSLNSVSYLWDFGDGNNSTLQNPIHLFDSSGTYTISLTVENCGLSDTLVQNIVINIPSSIDEMTSSISLFPNPAADVLWFKHTNHLTGSDYLVYNSSGKIVLMGKIQTEVTSISIKNLLPGFYYLRVGNKTQAFQKM